ncbi:MAG: hypothetical protein RL720_224 [Actinomycetota bacterium]|jgi:glycosyltransferase involved in cell wall biosynthesis
MRQRALLLTPVMPGHTGNGLSMRAGAWLEALSETHDVDVVVVPLYGAVSTATEWAESLACSVRVVEPETGLQLSGYEKELLNGLSHAAEITVVFRNVLASVAPLNSPHRLLDIDDLDWIREARLGNNEQAARERKLFEDYVTRFTVVSVANPHNVAECAAASKWVPVIAIPNVVREPNLSLDPAVEQDIDLLFVATMGYQPNEEAALWFLDHVLPQLPEVRVALVGAKPSEELLSRANENVLVTGYVEDLTSWYARAKVAIVPFLSGSGTRIKVLEAWSYGVPIVSTALGVEGLDAAGAARIADTPEQFARACRDLLETAASRTELIHHGRERLEHHQLATVTDALAQLLNTPEGVMSSHPTRRLDVEMIPAHDGFIVRLPGSDLFTWLNRTALMVFLLCTGQNSTEAIAGTIRHAFSLYRDPIEDVRHALDSLQLAGLIEGAEALVLKESVLIALWAPNSSVDRSVMQNMDRINANLRKAGIASRTFVDPTPSRALSKNLACTALITLESESHLLLLEATAEATAAAAEVDFAELIATGESFIGIPVQKPVVNWYRVASANSVPGIGGEDLKALSREFNLTFEGMTGPKRRVDGLVEARFISSEALLLSRAGLANLAGTHHVTRYRGRIGENMIERLEHVWGFFDLLTHPTNLTISEDISFCERWKAHGGHVMVARSGLFGESTKAAQRVLRNS